jgi:hypothetical protein
MLHTVKCQEKAMLNFCKGSRSCDALPQRQLQSAKIHLLLKKVWAIEIAVKTR